jgi:hypothetical protein
MHVFVAFQEDVIFLGLVVAKQFWCGESAQYPVGLSIHDETS